MGRFESLINSISRINHYRLILVAVLIAAATLTAYREIGTFDYINFDDDKYVYENPNISKGLTFENLKWAFSFDKDAIVFYWHPLTWLSYMIDAQVFGVSASTEHIINLVLHIINAILLFLLFHRMTGETWKSALVAFLFALHPVNVESVAWVSERKNVLSTFFWLMTMHAYVAYARNPVFKKYFIIFVYFILGLLAKPMLVTLPCALLLMDIWPLKRWQWFYRVNAPGFYQASSGYRLIIEKLPLFILALISTAISIFSVHYTEQIMHGKQIGFGLRTANAIVTYVKYLGKLLWPHDMAVFYPFPQTVPVWQIIGAAIVLVLITILVIIAFRKAPYLLIGWCWYLGILFPLIGLFQSGLWPELADRWVYIPEVGIFLMLVWGGYALVEKVTNSRRTVSGAVSLTVVSLLVVATGTQASYWKNSITMFQHTLAVTRNNHTAHFNLGTALAQEESYEEAMSHYTLALQGYPNEAMVYENMGVALAQTKHFDQAITRFKQAILLDPGKAEAHLNLACAFVQNNQLDEGFSRYRQAMSLEPRISPDKWLVHILGFKNEVGLALARKGHYKQAIGYFNEVILASPDNNKGARLNLAHALARIKEMDAAISQYRLVLKKDPRNAAALEMLNRLLSSKNQFETKKKEVEQKISTDPSNPDLYYQLGVLYESQGMHDQAIERFQAAARLNPQMMEAFYQQAYIYGQKEDYAKSLELFKKILSMKPETAVDVYYNIACIYSRLNQETDAVSWLEKAVDGGYSNWKQIRNDPDLDSIRETSFYKELMAKSAS